jgi:membrane-associated protease RseP (regulator of RpoE activity)
MVEDSGFIIEEGLLEYNIPKFYVTLKPETKQVFLRLYQQLNKIGMVPLFRRMENRVTLQIIRKPPTKPSRLIINIVLLLITIGTLFVTGYVLSLETIQSPVTGAIMFTAAIMSILGAHEMGHKIAMNRHGVEATYPYFIPGPPAPMGIGTFGAVIQQKSLAPNKDALFDLGVSGPLIGFLVTIAVTIVGIQLSQLISLPPDAGSLQIPLLFEYLIIAFPPKGNGQVILLHPVALAAWVGMIITTLQLIPVGQLDGGHIARALLRNKALTILAFISAAALFLIYWPQALITLFFLRFPDPGPLDDVSGLSRGRKFMVVIIFLVFILTVAPYASIFGLF